jgi:hypothetical protein
MARSNWGRLGGPHGEKAFTSFLAIERERSERSGRPFFLLLVEHEEGSVRIDSTVASQLFAGLQSCLRQTDFIGWYREGSAVGAVLTESRNQSGTDVSMAVGRRVSETLAARLSSGAARRLRVTVQQHHPNPRASTRLVSGTLSSADLMETLGGI